MIGRGLIPGRPDGTSGSLPRSATRGRLATARLPDLRLLPVAGTALFAALASPARADECRGLVEAVAAEAGARVESRGTDFARFSAGADTVLALACGGASHPSSVGVHVLGESLPDGYLDLLARVGQVVTGVAAEALREAARSARDRAAERRHGSARAAGARVTCSFTMSDGGRLTMCAVIGEAARI